MPPIDLRASFDTLRVPLAGVVLFLVAWWGISMVSSVLLLFVLAAVLAFVLAPLVELCERHLHLPRTLGIVLAYAVILLVLTGAGLLLVPPLVAQMRQTAGFVPVVLEELRSPSTPWGQAAQALGVGPDVSTLVAALSAQMQSSWDDVAREMFILVRGLGTSVVDVLLIGVISFYMLTGRHTLHGIVAGIVPAQHHATLIRIEAHIGDLLGRYLRARLLLSMIVGVLSGGAAQLLGLRFPIVLGSVAAVFELVPFVGPVLGAIPAVVVALAEGPPLRVLGVLLAFVVIQQVEGNILAPRLIGDAVRLPPLLVIFVVLVGAELGGGWGALLAAPVTGCVVTIVQEVWTARAETGPPSAGCAAEASSKPGAGAEDRSP